MPDTFQSGAYQVSAWIEEQYVPTAFKPTLPDNPPNKTDPIPDSKNKTTPEEPKGGSTNITTDKN